MRQIIRNERRCELALEGLRWYDIKRWKAGKNTLKDMSMAQTSTTVILSDWINVSSMKTEIIYGQFLKAKST